MGGDGDDLLAEEERGLGDGLADHRAAAAPAGAGTERGALGVALVHGDVVEVDADVLGDELCGGRLQSLTVRAGAEVHVDATVGVHADVRGLVGVRGHARLRFDVDRETDPEESTLTRSNDGLFRTKDGDAPADPTVRLNIGTLEGSNVNPVEAMVSMIAVARQFEVQMKMLSSADENARQATKLLSNG